MRQRVQRLTDSGVVQIVAVTDPLTLGFRRMAMIGLKVEGAQVAADKQTAEYAAAVAALGEVLTARGCAAP